MAGETFALENNDMILGINSPKESLGGPYSVVYKSLTERWAIVTMDWDEKAGLGIRWFWGNAGNPFSSGHPTWLVIPSSLCISLLNGLPLPYEYRKSIEKYLSGDISGEELSTLVRSRKDW